MIQRSLLYLGAVFYLLNGVRMIANPQGFFDGTAGVSATGGYNVHFIVDIGFAFLVSAGAMAAGVWLRRRSLILAGLAWPVLHAAFHTAGLAMHGAVSRAAWMVETGGVILPALLLAALALRVPLSGLGAGMPRLVHAGLRRFEAQWSYDAAYLHRLVDTVPDSMRAVCADHDRQDLRRWCRPRNGAGAHPSRFRAGRPGVSPRLQLCGRGPGRSGGGAGDA